MPRRFRWSDRRLSHREWTCFCDCLGCRLGAYEAVYRIEGVEQATASFKAGLMTAWIDARKTTRAALESALQARRIPLATPEN
jgi:hypothetical protein